jgi:5-methylthioadenosine/S-adenosylhomocysteine deaminase
MTSPTGELWLVGGTILTMDACDTVWTDGALGISAGKIRYVGPRDRAPVPPGARTVDCSSCLVLPGFTNTHTHTGMTLLRGIADDLPLEPWLRTAIFPLEEKWGNAEFVRLGTQLAAIEMIRSGTTTFNDMYYFEEHAARASSEIGLRLIAGQTIVEISGVEKRDADIFHKFDVYLDEVRGLPLVYPAISPHSIYGVSLTTWEKVVAFVRERDLILHTHLAETQDEMDRCQRAYGKTPTQVFDELGVWPGKVIAAHATCVTAEDIEILGRNRVGIAHNPESNLKLGTRICPVVELRRAGCPVGLGTDGTASNNNLDLLQEADTAAKLQVFRLGAGQLKARDAVRMLTSEGARAVGFGEWLGSLEVGKSADAIAVDISQAHATPLYDPYSHLIYSASGHDVKHSVVDGRILMEDRALLTIDEAAVLREARAWGKRIAASRQ